VANPDETVDGSRWIDARVSNKGDDNDIEPLRVLLSVEILDDAAGFCERLSFWSPWTIVLLLLLLLLSLLLMLLLLSSCDERSEAVGGALALTMLLSLLLLLLLLLIIPTVLIGCWLSFFGDGVGCCFCAC
jgi:hypothetical protein